MSDLENDSLASSMYANAKCLMDFCSLKAKAGGWPCISNTEDSVISQAILKFQECAMSVCAQAYLLSSLSSAFKINKVCLDRTFKLYLAKVRARNQRLVVF